MDRQSDALLELRKDPARFSLPPDFVFGVSVSGYRVEGGYNRGNRPRNNWGEWEREDLPQYLAERQREWNAVFRRLAVSRWGDNSPRTASYFLVQRGSRRFFRPLQLAETARCVAEGLPVKGYFYWSLTDNYEWGSYQPCFGLYSYEFETGGSGRATASRWPPDLFTPSWRRP